MKDVLTKFLRVYRRIFGSKVRLVLYEQQVLDAWRKSLPKEQRSILDAQIQATDVIQRQAGGAKLCFFHNGDPQPHKIALFKNRGPDQHVADVFLKGERSDDLMRAKIYVHRGLFFSIEFSKRPQRYMKLHNIEQSSLGVSKVDRILSFDENRE